MPIAIQATIPTTLPLDVPAILAETRDASVRALATWGRTPQGIGVRFTRRAFGLYGLAERSPSYASKHPEPYVASGQFRDGVLGGSGTRVASSTMADGFQATLVSPAARGLNFRRGAGIYAAQWAALHPAEGQVIDGAVQAELSKIEVTRG